jgi:hypothetical protein
MGSPSVLTIARVQKITKSDESSVITIENRSLEVPRSLVEGRASITFSPIDFSVWTLRFERLMVALLIRSVLGS